VSEKRPLRVLVTRPRHQASALAELLVAAGAEPILIPTIEIVPPASFDALDDSLKELDGFDWLIFTSANAVQVFAERAQALGVEVHAKRIAVIGSATARAAREFLGRSPDLVPEHATAEGLAEALLAYAAGSSMLLVRAAVARDVLPERLKAAGARVRIAEAYRNVIPADSIREIQELFASDPPDAVTFTSASTAQNLHALLDAAELEIREGTVLASIGPITSRAMREVGMEPTVEAGEATIASLVDALLASARRP
jgi:uroporphyrinogen-III synthase